MTTQAPAQLKIYIHVHISIAHVQDQRLMAVFNSGLNTFPPAHHTVARPQSSGHNAPGTIQGEENRETRIAIRDVTPHQANTVSTECASY